MLLFWNSEVVISVRSCAAVVAAPGFSHSGCATAESDQLHLLQACMGLSNDVLDFSHASVQPWLAYPIACHSVARFAAIAWRCYADAHEHHDDVTTPC